MYTQEGDASHDGLVVLVSTTLPLLRNHKPAHDLPDPFWVRIEVHLKTDSGRSATEEVVGRKFSYEEFTGLAETRLAQNSLNYINSSNCTNIA